MELLKRVNSHESFVFCNEQINHIEDLVAVLKNATEDEYSTYATEDKNDFANWVEHVLHSKDVADKLRASVSKYDTVNILESEINSRKQEFVLESKESILTQAPIERPEQINVEVPVEFSLTKESITPTPTLSESISSAPEKFSFNEEESTTPPPTPDAVQPWKPNIVEETPSSPIISEQVNFEVDKVSTTPPPTPDAVQPWTPKVVESVEEIPLPIEKNISENKIEENIPKTNNVELPYNSSSESIIPNVVTPINEENSNKLQSNAKPHHFCGVHMDCMRREFIFGLLIGLLIGFVGLQMIHLML